MLTVAGCSRQPPRVAAPELDPAEVARRAIETYDKNGDGQLAADELSPGLKALAETADADKDGTLIESEIKDRLQAHVDSRLGLQDVGGMVTLDGQPLPNAKVTFVPDPVLEGIVDPASGESDDTGFVQMAIAGQDLPGVRPGFYRVEVSRLDGNNKELLPARYNSESELGEEVGPVVSQGAWQLNLKSR